MKNPHIFQAKILAWFEKHGRKDLPWQHNPTPYRVWISEIMLQQTQVQTVIPYFLKFMQIFPTLETLAQADEDQVLHLWSGLGYYSRARNLHRAAKNILATKKFPDTLPELMELPGIGRSTAGAILAMGFNKQATILDGNVKRVLMRFFAIQTWADETETARKLWEYAETLTPATSVAAYTQAMMDLGATVCVRSQPNCSTCPLIENCEAYRLNLQSQIPKTKPKKQLPVKQSTFLLIQDDQHILLEKRPPSGIWASLWSLPELEWQASESAIREYCLQSHFKVLTITPLGVFRHTFSHFHLDILPIIISVKRSRKLLEDQQQIWYNLRQPSAVGLPAPIQLLLEKLTHDV